MYDLDDLTFVVYAHGFSFLVSRNIPYIQLFLIVQKFCKFFTTISHE